MTDLEWQLMKALKELSAQYAREKQRQAELVKGLTRQVQQLDMRVATLAADFERIADAFVAAAPNRAPRCTWLPSPRSAPGRLLQAPPRPRQAAQTGPRRRHVQTRRPRRHRTPLGPPLAALRALRTGACMNPAHFRAFMEITLDFQHGCF